MRLTVIGAGGHASVIVEIARRLNYTSFTFYDDFLTSANIAGTTDDFIEDSDGSHFFVAIGDNDQRRKTIERLKHHNLFPISLIDPTAVIASNVVIGKGSVCMPHTVVNPYSAIGSGCIINTKASVDHHCTVGDYSHLAPNTTLAGNVSIGSCTLCGVSSSFNPRTTVGDHVLIGSGSLVIKDIPDNTVAFGIPARPMN